MNADTALLPSRWVPALAGACFACTALAFHYLDRHYGSFNAVVVVAWLLATALGFGVGAAGLGRTSPLARTACALLGIVGGLLALVPGFFYYDLLRWIALCLLFAAVARAPLMSSRKDLYLCLTICFVVTCTTINPMRADWTLWVYLGPALLFAGLALTVEYVAARAVPGWIQVLSSAGFVIAVGAVALVLFLWLPRPPGLGFGFLPTGGAVNGPVGQTEGRLGDRSGTPGASHPLERGAWAQMIDGMRSALNDTEMPTWQRNLLGTLLDALASPPASATAGASPVPAERQVVTLSIPYWWFAALLLALLLAAMAWRRRHAIALGTLSGLSRLVVPVHAGWGMRLCAMMIECCLAWADRPRPRHLTLRERVALAQPLPPTSRHWLDDAVTTYYRGRFGLRPPTPEDAARVRLLVLDAAELALAHRQR